jgi:hypothetical protein
MPINRDLLIFATADPDTLDIQPRGQGCYSGFAEPFADHNFFLTTEAAGFTYKICGRCGTVRIGEQR